MLKAEGGVLKRGRIFGSLAYTAQGIGDALQALLDRGMVRIIRIEPGLDSPEDRIELVECAEVEKRKPDPNAPATVPGPVRETVEKGDVPDRRTSTGAACEVAVLSAFESCPVDGLTRRQLWGRLNARYRRDEINQTLGSLLNKGWLNCRRNPDRSSMDVFFLLIPNPATAGIPVCDEACSA